MTDVRRVTDDFSVAPQLATSDFTQLASDGYLVIVNNRPDGEAPNQISDADAKATAEALGLGYVHIPIVGAPSLEAVEALAATLTTQPGRTLAYCRSGTRSITLWALAQAKTGAMAPQQAISAARQAGYDLSHLGPVLTSLEPG